MSRLIVDYEEHNQRFVIHADPNRRDWQKPEYYREFKRVAASMVPTGGQVMVRLGENIVAVLPDQDDIHLGRVPDDKVIVTQLKHTSDGRTLYNIVSMDRDDPRLSGYDLPDMPEIR